MNLDAKLEELLLREGGYVNHPSDRGGPTNYGITLATARAFGYSGDLRRIPVATAKAIYTQRYWHAPRFSEISNVAIADECFDTGVNMGPHWAALFLQRALNSLTKEAALLLDGRIGELTLYRLATFLKARKTQGETVILRLLNAQQAVRYMELTESKETQKDFMFGWTLNRVGAL